LVKSRSFKNKNNDLSIFRITVLIRSMEEYIYLFQSWNWSVHF